MSAQMNRLRSARAVNWRTVLGLLLVPLTAAGVLLWGLWNPTDRLDTVTAAVVNLDEPVTVDGQMVPLGRVLAAELIDGDTDNNFTWQLTDEKDAAAGLDDGRYTTVVTIPENFSAAATSTSKAASGDGSVAETATIDIATSERGRLLDSALSNIVTTTATSVLNEQLGAQFVGGIFVGMTKIGEGVGEAAEGATQLANGGQALASGADQLASGATELANGTQQLAEGTAALSTGVGAYAGGAATIAEMYRPLGQGATAAVQQLKTMIIALGQLQANSAEPQAQVGGGLVAVGNAMDPEVGLPADIATLVADCYASGASADFCVQLQSTLGGRAAEIGGGFAQVQQGMLGLQTAQDTFQQTIAGSGQQGGSGDPIGDLDTLSAGLDQFGNGLNDFAAKGAAVADGAAQLAAGTPSLAAGASQLSGGVTELASGAHKTADGTAGLASGLEEAASGIPNLTKSESERLGEIATRPVEATGASDELFNASGVPLFAGIALWAGAFASFLVLAPLWRRTREAARGVGYVTLRSALPAAALGALQGAIVGAILPILLGYGFVQGLGFFGLALLAGTAFSLVNQGLSALFGGLGRFVSFALLVVAFAIGVISTAPPLLQAIGDGSPIGALFEGFQAVAMGTSGAGSAVFALVLWGLAGLGLTAFAVVRSRKRPLA